jgi:hypothetical protein
MPISQEEFEQLGATDPVVLLRKYFKRIRKAVPIQRNWRSEITGAYSPEIDIAVGPFAIHPSESLIEQYDELVCASRSLINSFVNSFRENSSRYEWLRLGKLPENYTSFLSPRASNPNARCFMAIEMESEATSIKHRLGSMVNACALGRIGIVVARNDGVLKSLFRLLAYLHFLEEVRKPSFDTSNVIIATKEQIDRIFDRSIDTYI